MLFWICQSAVEHKIKYFILLYYFIIFSVVSGYHQLFGSKYIILCSTEEKNSYRFERVCGRVNDDFWVKYPFKRKIKNFKWTSVLISMFRTVQFVIWFTNWYKLLFHKWSSSWVQLTDSVIQLQYLTTQWREKWSMNNSIYIVILSTSCIVYIYNNHFEAWKHFPIHCSCIRKKHQHSRQNISFCVPCKKEKHMGLEQHKVERVMIFVWTVSLNESIGCD